MSQYEPTHAEDRKSTRLNSSHPSTSYAVFCLKKKKDTRCVLALIGSPRLSVSSLQHVRLVLLSNCPAAGAAVPFPNACAGVGFIFFFNDTATTEIYTLSLHDALPI